MREKVLKIVFSFCMVLFLLPLQAMAQDLTYNGDLYFTDSNSGYFVKLINPTNKNISSNVIDTIDFRLYWYDRTGSMPYDSGTPVTDGTVKVTYTDASANSIEVPGSGGEYVISNYNTGLTQSQKNFGVTIKVQPIDGTTKDPTNYNAESGSVTIHFNYYNNDSPGASYTTSYADKITAFNNRLTLSFPKNGFITSQSNYGSVAPDQTINITVGSIPTASTPQQEQQYTFLSNEYDVGSAVTNAVYSSNDLKPLSTGTITLTYNNSLPSDVSLYNVAIVKKDANNNWISYGGSVNSSGMTVTAPFDGFGSYAVALAYRSSSISSPTGSEDWAIPAAKILAYKGVLVTDNNQIQGSPNYPSATAPNLGPKDTNLENNIDRFHFTVMLTKALGYAPITYDPNTFADVTSAVYSNTYTLSGLGYNGPDYIMAAVKNGLIQGTGVDSGGNNLMSPTDTLTREEAAVFIGRALKLNVNSYADVSNSGTSKTDQQLAKYYSDVSSISEWARPYVLAITTAKIMAGSNGQFSPTDPLKYSDASALIYKTMDKLKLFGR